MDIFFCGGINLMAKKIRIIPWLDTKELYKQLEQLGKKKQKINVEIDGDKDINTANKNMRQLYGTAVSTNTVFGKLRNMLSNTFSGGKIAMTGYLMILKEINKAGQNVEQTIQSIDKAITDLQIATDMNRESVAALVKDYNAYAKELSSVTKNITDAADDYLRAGKTMSEAQELIKYSVMLSKLGKIESGDATKDLLATMNGYEMNVEEVGKALDAMVAIDMKAATSSGELSTGLKYSASSANSAGVQFNKLIAILATVQDKTQQSAETVGTFANTMLSRYRDVKIGNYLSEDGEDISDYESVLKSVGIQLRDSNGEFRDFENVLQDMAMSWDTLSSSQQNALIKVAAGTRQQNRWIALMEGYDKVLELTEVAADSAGTAVDKFNNSYMNSIEAKQNKLQASFESMVINSNFDEVYADILEVTTALVDFINETNALKGAMTALTVSTGIKFFLAVKTGVNEAYISLNQFANALKIVKQTNISSADFDKLLLLSNGLSASQTKLLLSSKNLSLAQKELILTNSGLSTEEAKLQLQTWGMASAQTGLTASTTTLGNAMKGLFATMAANPLTVLVSGITMASMAFNAYKNNIEEVRRATEESATAYKESSSSIDEYTSRYQELRQALLDAKGNEEGTYNVKKQLLDLQTELNDKFGDEYGKINLVTDAYKDQTEAIKAYNKEAAQTYLNENQKGIKNAEKQMTKERHYNLSGVGISQYTDAGSALRDIAERYKNQGISLLDNEDGTYSIHLNADASSAYDTINSFENDLRDKAKELGDEHLFDDVLEISSDSLNKAKDTIEKFGDTFKQALIAEIAVDDTKANKYAKALSAVDNYNNAVISSSDPYNDENVQKARQDLEAVKQEIQNNETEWGKYSLLMNDVFSQADTHILDFNQRLQNDTGLQKLAEDLKGIQDVELEALNPGDNESFDKLKASAEEAGVSVEELIDLLIRAGIVQGEIASHAENTSLGFDTTSLEDLNDQIDSIQSAYKALYSASEEYNQYGYVTADTLQTLLALDSQYLACLIDENGQLAINGTTYQNLVQAKLADAEATAVQQAIEELSKVTTEQQIEADKTAIGIIAEKGSVLASLTGQYGALAEVAVSAAQAQALADGYSEASNKNKAEADKIMSNLNAKLALIQSTAKNTSGSFGSLTNHLNGFSSASNKAKDSTDAFTKSLQKQKDALEDEKEALEDKKEYYEKVSDAVNWFFDKQIKGVEKVISGLEKENDLLKDQLSDFDSALTAVDRLYERQQNALKDKIYAMKEATTQSEKELAVEKAKMALQEAQRNKTKMLYVKGKGFTFTKDDSAISDANDNLANANADLVEYKIQQEIDKIQELRDAWAEIPKIKQQAEQDSLASQIIGSNWEAQLLNGRLETINTFKDSYLGIQAEIDNNESMIASYEEKVQYYQGLKDEWQALLDRYTEYENTQLLIMEFGNDYQNELLNGRTERWDKFAEDFFNVQVQLKSVTDQIADITKRMEDYAARMESAASRAESAAARIKAAGNGVGGGNDTSERSYYLKPYDFTGHAKGGFITKKDKSYLDPLAEVVGEDHMIAVQEGEYVVPKETVKKNPELVNTLIDGKDIPNTPNLQEEIRARMVELGIVPKSFAKAIDAKEELKSRYKPVTSITLGDKTLSIDEFYEIGRQLVAYSVPNFNTDYFNKMLKQGNIVNNTTNNQNRNVTELHFHDGISLPNITDGNDARKLIDELSGLSLKAYQYANKR